MKMKKTDIGVVAFMYVVCGYFFAETLKLPADSQTYPKFTIYLLFGLTTLYLITMVVAAKKHGVTSGVDEVFKEFVPKQFFICLAATILYLVLIYVLGFYIATALFMIGVMMYLRVPILYTLIATAVIILLVYFAFAKFLSVRLPLGLVFKALR